MSDMEDFIDVKVTQRGREIAEGCYKLPVTIGRAEHNSVRIGHSPQDMTISRTHAIIQRAAGQLQLVDKSANGTVYRCERIKQGNAVDLGVADSFEIFDFKTRPERNSTERGFDIRSFLNSGIHIIALHVRFAPKPASGLRFGSARQ